MDESYVGEIRMFAGDYAPQGWAICDGRLLSIFEYEALFSLIGTTYGGDGTTTFALPDLRGRIPLHMGTNPATGTNYALAEKKGTESVTLTQNQLPAHTHGVQANSQPGDNSLPDNRVFASPGERLYSDDEPNADMQADLVTQAGGNQPHENMMPFLAVTFIISLFGMYPVQS